MSEAVDFQKMRRELIELYEEFLANPGNETTEKKAIKLDRNFGGLSYYNEILSSQPVPKDVEGALNGLSTIYQYGSWEESHEAFSNDKILLEAKKILEELCKS